MSNTKFPSFLNMARTARAFGLEKTYLKIKLSNDIDDFIAKEDHRSILTFVDKGYELTKTQLFNMMAFVKPVENQDVIDKMFNLYETELKEPYLKMIISATKKYKKTKFYGSGFKIILNLVQDIHNVSNFIITHHEFKTFFKKDEFTLEAHKQFKDLEKSTTHLRDIAVDYSYREYRDEIKTANGLFLELARTANRQVPYISELSIETALSKVVDEYSVLFKEENKPKKTITKFNTKEMSSECRNLIADINQIYANIQTETLTIEQKLEIENMYDKRLPQLVEQYNNLAPTYKNKFKEHTDSPDKLFVEALESIKKNINEIFEAHQEANHNQLKITHRYLTK